MISAASLPGPAIASVMLEPTIWTVLAAAFGSYVGLQVGYLFCCHSFFEDMVSVAVDIDSLTHALIARPLLPDGEAHHSEAPDTMALLVEFSGRLAYFSAPDFSTVHAILMTDHYWHALPEYIAALDSAAVAMAADVSGLDFGSLPALIDCSRAQLRIMQTNLPPPASHMNSP